MKYSFSVSVDTQSGEYDVQFQNIDSPEQGVDYDELMPMVHAVLRDLDARMNATREAARAEAGEGDDIRVYVYGDDQAMN